MLAICLFFAWPLHSEEKHAWPWYPKAKKASVSERRGELTQIGEVTLGQPIVFLRDLTSCKGNSDLCQEVGDLEVASFNSLEKTKILSQEKILALLQDSGYKEIALQGAAQTALSLAKIDLPEDKVRADLEEYLQNEGPLSYQFEVSELKFLRPIRHYDLGYSLMFPDLMRGVGKDQVRAEVVNRSTITQVILTYDNPTILPEVGALRLRIEAKTQALLLTEDLASGAALSGEDVKTEWRASDGRGPRAVLADLLGQVLRANQKRGHILLQSDLTKPFVVSYGQTLALSASKEAVAIQIKATAMERGRVGDLIRVKLGAKVGVKARIIDEKTVIVE